MIVEDPVFLTLGEIIEIHRDQVERYRGDPNILGCEITDNRGFQIDGFLHGSNHDAADYQHGLITKRVAVDLQHIR
jgi:hypothetical protein